MIKLIKGDKPDYLSDEKVAELTIKFSETKASVWNHSQIKEPLSESSNGKCAYCETVVKDPGIYMEVEHFKHKNASPELVVDWDNLLPSCKRCNGTKSAKDKLIINPYLNDPRADLFLDRFFILGSTELGEDTESIIDLNEDDLLVKRFRITSIAIKKLKEIAKDFREIEKLDHHKRKRFKNILLMAQSSKPYSATVSATIHSMEEYLEIKNRLSFEELWTEELERLHVASMEIALPLKKR
ncbi:HNH endonuclease [Acinetobacter nosocomialis]|uniref:HNH endonuclease n=1 Tax=Acinetobacter nosocomialis TaxID=106654 RepID=UPI00237EB6DC|nr:HNH endonuclease [Acinetobacter nosocomialis]MDE1703232.1 HNH endonuclease [Acinetobacter nosocomialis]HDG7211741.1 HNH endonuclease [Acinetobacter nosocomialis]